MGKSDNVAEEALAFAHDVKFQSGGAANELQEEAVSADVQSELPGFTDIQQPRRNFNETAFFFPQCELTTRRYAVGVYGSRQYPLAFSGTGSR